MKAMVGSSILENAYDAGVETAKNSLKGLKTPAQMQSIYAPGSVSWADQVNSYINDVKAK